MLLNYLLHSHDLLIKTSPSTWLVVQHANPESAASFLSRMAKETTSLNRNRPQGPLPVLDVQQQGILSIHASGDELMHPIRCIANAAFPSFALSPDHYEVNHV
ncbi:hypothetical protein RMSM_06790 [Rhodopirellula maiorica SM1]|uniref:Uncharacterized protein n=1 Tax=Rhodopirellula maiorica SM1 TaxID=1265738 RepID=M5RAB0_9BACT|nr:hypothetical protein RMSM_06790 [Rhodopirellula maiorica SM1]